MADQHAETRARIQQVYREYPWLLPLLRNAERWQNKDGSSSFSTEFDDYAGKREGFLALAAAMGATFVEHPPADLMRGPSGASRPRGATVQVTRPA